MKAWSVRELGEPLEVMHLTDVEPPRPTDGEVLLDVEAVALNFPDVLLCRGLYQEKPPLPFTPGLEICGRDRDGRRWLGGAPLPRGGLAEQVAVPRAGLFPVPDDMPAPTAAALMVTYQTGHVGLHRRARLQEGETLLVHAGAGGVGSAAIQLGLAAGARVLATAGGPAKVEVCRRLGAEVVVDYLADDFVAAVKDATDGRGADVIYDSVGGETFTRSTKCIAFEGRIVVVGFAGGAMAQAATNHVLIKNYSVVGLHWGLYRSHDPGVIPATHQSLMALWAQRLIDPMVGAQLPMAQAAQGLAQLADRATVGKLVVLPGV